MIRSLAVGALALGASGRTLWNDLETKSYSYADWKAEHGARYPGSEEVFNANLQKIREHNSNPSNTWKAGVNKVCKHLILAIL